MKGQKRRNLLVTGATGFVGSRLCEVAARKNFGLRRALRRKSSFDGVETYNLGPHTDWSPALDGIDTVIHLAGRVHIMADEADDPLGEFRRVNVDGTANLARQAARAGVQRLIFISSIKVNGETTPPGKSFTISDNPAPKDAYAVSKFEAEEALRTVASETGLAVVVIRPPLVYGPGVKANFLRLIKAVQKGTPLPLGRIRNKRSLVALDNLVDLILTCVDHPAAAGQVFLVSDGKDLSTPDLIRKLARAMGRPARLLPVPAPLVRLGGKLIGKRPEVDRLIGSLQVDIRHTCETLGWRPPVSSDDAIRETVRDFVSRSGND